MIRLQANTMNIGIIGSGNVGKTLARGFKANGHQVVLGTRNPEKAELCEWAEPLGVLLDTVRGGNLWRSDCHRHPVGKIALGELNNVYPRFTSYYACVFRRTADD